VRPIHAPTSEIPGAASRRRTWPVARIGADQLTVVGLRVRLQAVDELILRFSSETIDQAGSIADLEDLRARLLEAIDEQTKPSELPRRERSQRHAHAEGTRTPAATDTQQATRERLTRSVSSFDLDGPRKSGSRVAALALLGSGAPAGERVSALFCVVAAEAWAVGRERSSGRSGWRSTR
jgi:hypothetical protein